MQNQILRLNCKNVFCYFEPVRGRLDSKFAKSANMTKKSLNKNSIWVSKHAKFDADLKSIEKVTKQLNQKKLEG